MSTKRRRILDEDDSDLDNEGKNPSLVMTTASTRNTTTSDNKSAHNEHHDDDEQAKNTVMRMLRNTKKSNVKVQLNKPTLPDSDDKKVGTASIPRKASAQIPTTIPKRGRDEIPKKSKAIDDKDPNSTLLSLSMLPMPSSAVTQSQSQKPQTFSSLSGVSTSSTSGTGTTATAAPSRPNTTPPPPPIAAAAPPPPPATSASATTMPINDSMTTTRRPKPPSTTTRPPEARMGQLSPVRMDIIDTGVPSGQPPLLQHQPHQLASLNAPPPPPARLKDEEKRVLNTLKTLCSKVNVQLQPTDDLLSGSFVREPATAVAEFDQDDERRIPIFPEDFAQGQPLWPLSWWGIVDPILSTTANDEGATTGTVLATSSTAGGSAKQRHNATASAIQNVMEHTKQLVEGTTKREADTTPSATGTTAGHDDYNNTDRHPHRDHHHHSNSDRRSRGDRSDHDRRRHDDSDRRRRRRSRHDQDGGGGGDGDGRRLDGDDRRTDGPPPFNWDHSNPSSGRRMGHPLNPPPGVPGSPPRDPGHPRRGPPPRY